MSIPRYAFTATSVCLPAQDGDWVRWEDVEALLPKACGCYSCLPHELRRWRMTTCQLCGNKRCPHATDHRNACTGSNEPGQVGSRWEKCLTTAEREIAAELETYLL